MTIARTLDIILAHGPELSAGGLDYYKLGLWAAGQPHSRILSLNPALAALLQAELTPDGFFQAADPRHRSQTSQPGLFLAGTAEGPRDIAGCISQATAAARQVSQYVKKS